MTCVSMPASTCVRPEPPSFATTTFLLGGAELRQALFSRWFFLYTAAFVTLGLGISAVSAMSGGGAGLDGFGRTSAGLINLVLLIVPLMGLTAGASAVAPLRERGSLAYLLAQPVRPIELLLGKFVGLSLSMVASIALGFGLCALILAARGSSTDGTVLVRLALLSTFLAAASVSAGLAISVFARRGAVATGVAIFVWLMLVFVSDLALMAAVGALHLRASELFYASLANPLQVFKMWAMTGADSTLDVLGPAGLYGSDHFGASLRWLFAGSLAAWTLVPLAVAAAGISWRSRV